jgi:hypothetical protein
MTKKGSFVMYARAKPAGGWTTADEGATEYGYSDGRSFQRVLHRMGITVLGATFDGHVWSCPQDPVGAIPDIPTRILALQGANGVELVYTSGTISGSVYVVGVSFNRQHPWAIVVAQDGCSGVMVMPNWRFQTKNDCCAEQL